MNSILNKDIESRLQSFVEKEKRNEGLIKLFSFIIVFASSIFVISLFELLFNFDSLTRTIIFFLSVLALFFFFIFSVVLPIIKDFIKYTSPDYTAVAKKIGIHFPEIKDELSNAIQLIQERNRFYSTELIDASFERIYNKSKNYDFNSIIDYRYVKKIGRIAATGVLIIFLLLFFIPELHNSFGKIINYNKNFTLPPKFSFVVEPGSINITRGDNVKISISIIGEQQSEISLNTKSQEQSEFITKKLYPDSLGEFNYVFSSVTSSFDYFANASNINSDVYNISVITRPVIKNLELKILSPSYTKQSPIIQKDNGNITALAGSRVDLQLTSSRELSHAKIIFSDSTINPMKIIEENASSSFNIKSEKEYKILIKDLAGSENTNPISYSINILQDQFPSIISISPNKNVDLGQDGKLPLNVRISDDYGFSKLSLNYKLLVSKYRAVNEDYIELPISISKEIKEDDVYYIWDLSPLVLAEGEIISYYLEIFDNDNINGPKSARTSNFTIQVPSIQDLFTLAEQKQQTATDDLTETLKDSEELQEELQKISNELKQNIQDISWQEKEKIEKAAAKFNELSKRVEDISKTINELQKDLLKNNLLSEETLQKYNELQDLLEEFNSEELLEAFKKMQDALKTLMREQVQMSFEDLKANEEYFKKSLERTLNLLKRIQIEQKLDELVKLSEDILQKIENQKNKTEQSSLNDKSKREELAGRQEDITSDLNNIKNELDNLDKKMNQFKDMPHNLMNKLKSDYNEQNNTKLSEEALKNLNQSQKMQALQNQQQLSQNMNEFGRQMQNLQEAVMQMNQMRTLTDMMKILNDLITLSKSQEELKNKTDLLSPGSKEFTANSHEQLEIQNNLNKILQNMTALSQKTFAITPEMGKSIGSAFSEMQQSITFLQNQNSLNASLKQTGAMKYLNEASTLMKGAMDQMMSGGQSGGMMSLMQQLQQMTQQQMNLNQLTQMMNQGQITQDMLAQMQRLAQQQEMIRKALEQLNQEARESGQSKRFASNLDKILEEMKEVVSNLQTEKLDDSVIKQQERILSKLLDAQRSINERDFEKERKSNTGQNVDRKSPPDLILSTEEGKNKLRDELMKAIREGYKKDYEELIRKYFEALEKSNRER